MGNFVSVYFSAETTKRIWMIWYEGIPIWIKQVLFYLEGVHSSIVLLSDQGKNCRLQLECSYSG